MSNFSKITAFGLVRRIAVAGKGAPSLYLLICSGAVLDAVRADIMAEVHIQLRFNPRFLAASDIQLRRLKAALRSDRVRPLIVITLDRWLPKLVSSLDRNVVLLTKAGIVLLVATRTIANRLLTAAPNLSNRLTDVLAIKPDQAFGDPSL